MFFQGAAEIITAVDHHPAVVVANTFERGRDLAEPGPQLTAVGGIAAATDAIPAPLVEQLAAGGRLVAPLGGRRGQQLVRLTKTDDGLAETWSVACRFVPLVRA